jgi:hypothetical protein
MLHKRIRYTLRLGIAPGQWQIAVHPPNSPAVEKPFRGNKQEAESAARSMIDTWLKSHADQRPKVQSDPLPLDEFNDAKADRSALDA